MRLVTRGVRGRLSMFEMIFCYDGYRDIIGSDCIYYECLLHRIIFPFPQPSSPCAPHGIRMNPLSICMSEHIHVSLLLTARMGDSVQSGATMRDLSIVFLS